MKWKRNLDCIGDYFWMRDASRFYGDACLMIAKIVKKQEECNLDTSRTFIHFGMVFCFEL